MKTTYRSFFYGLAWNTIESLIYQIVLIIHFIMVYRHTEPNLFGVVGIIFSLLYLATFLANLGFDTALAPHARLLSSNVHFWHAILIPHFLIQILIYMGIGSIGIFINYYGIGTIRHLPTPIAITLALLLISEAVKKTLRTIAHLLFYNKTTALIELISGITLYVPIVWTLYAYYHEMTLEILFIPLLVTSLLSCCLLGLHVYRVYATLSESALPVPTQRSFIITRLYSYGSHLGHVIFSSNCLIPFFALHIGLAHAGIFKLMSTITHSMQSIINAMFGPTSQALFSHLYDTHPDEKQHLFSTITEQLHHIVYGFIIFFIINYPKIFTLTAISPASSTTTLMIIFFIIQCTEQLFIVYEKFFIAHNAPSSLCIISLCSGAACATVLLTPLSLPATTLMLIVLALRIITLSTLATTAYYLFNIRPALTIRINYLMYAFISALIFCIIF